jgi:hypothetical protein
MSRFAPVLQSRNDWSNHLSKGHVLMLQSVCPCKGHRHWSDWSNGYRTSGVEQIPAWLNPIPHRPLSPEMAR